MVPTQKRVFFGGDVRFPGKIRFKRLLPLSIFPPKELSGFPYKSRLLGGFRCCCCQKSFWGFGKKKKKGTICVAMYSKLRDFGFCTLASCAAKSEKGLFTMFPSFPPLPNCSKHLPRKKETGSFSVCRIDVRPVVSAPPPPPTQPQGQKGENRGMSRGGGGRQKSNNPYAIRSPAGTTHTRAIKTGRGGQSVPRGK